MPRAKGLPTGCKFFVLLFLQECGSCFWRLYLGSPELILRWSCISRVVVNLLQCGLHMVACDNRSGFWPRYTRFYLQCWAQNLHRRHQTWMFQHAPFCFVDDERSFSGILGLDFAKLSIRKLRLRSCWFLACVGNFFHNGDRHCGSEACSARFQALQSELLATDHWKYCFLHHCSLPFGICAIGPADAAKSCRRSAGAWLDLQQCIPNLGHRLSISTSSAPWYDGPAVGA